MNIPMIKKHLVVYRAKCHDLAPHIAIVRSQASKEVYKKGTRYYRENESLISLNGITAELVARDWLQSQYKQGKVKQVDLTPLVDLDPIAEADGIVDGKVVDFKHKGNGNRVFVNYASHNNKNKRCDVYYFVESNEKVIESESGVIDYCNGVIYEIPASLVDHWEYTDKWVDKCYFYDIQETDIIK